MRRMFRPLPLLALAPLLAGNDRCGLFIEQTENLQFYEPIALVELDVHHGSVQGTMFERPTIYVKRHTSGFDPGVGEFGQSVEDETLRLIGHCDIENECWYDHMLELTPGTGLDLTFRTGYIELSEIDGPITAAIEEGTFHGYRLAAPAVDLDYRKGHVVIEWARAPSEVVITVGEGDVALTLPAGSYACEVSPAPVLEGIVCDPEATGRLRVTAESGAVILRAG